MITIVMCILGCNVPTVALRPYLYVLTVQQSINKKNAFMYQKWQNGKNAITD